jgi:hypothetical protein
MNKKKQPIECGGIFATLDNMEMPARADEDFALRRLLLAHV